MQIRNYLKKACIFRVTMTNRFTIYSLNKLIYYTYIYIYIMNQINFNHFTSLYATISFLKHISPDASFHKMIHFSRVFIASYLRMLPVSRLKRSESNIGQF